MTRRPHVASHFNHHSRIYDLNPITRWIGKHELGVLLSGLPDVSHVLDYGCGTGRVTLALLQQGRTVTGYDISPGMIATAEKRVRAAGYTARLVTQRSELQDGTWRLITSMGVLDYFPDPAEYLADLRRLLAPVGGWFSLHRMPRAHWPDSTCGARAGLYRLMHGTRRSLYGTLPHTT